MYMYSLSRNKGDTMDAVPVWQELLTLPENLNSPRFLGYFIRSVFFRENYPWELMEYPIGIDGNTSTCKVADDEVSFTNSKFNLCLNINDVIGCEGEKSSLCLWYVQKGEENKLRKHELKVTGDGDVCEQLHKDITDKLRKISKRPKNLLVLINPIGGNARGKRDFDEIVAPVFKMANINCDVIVSEKSKHMTEVAETYDFSKVDGVVIFGGDGSYHEVVNVLMRKRQESAGIDYNDPTSELKPLDLPIAMVPSGTGNGVAEGNVGCRDILTSALHVIKGTTSMTSLIGIYADNKLTAYGGTTVTFGSMTDLLYYSDRKFRCFGRLRYALVPIWMFMITGLRTFNAAMTFFTKTSKVEASSDDGEGSNTENQIEVQGKKVAGFKSYTQNEVVYEGNFKLLMVTNGNLLRDRTTFTFDVANMYKRPRHLCTATIFKENMSVFQVLKFIAKGYSRKGDVHEDERMWFSMNIKATRVKGNTEKKLPERGQRSEAEMLEHIISIDGEMYEFEEMDIYQRLHDDVVKIYTSFFRGHGPSMFGMKH